MQTDSESEKNALFETLFETYQKPILNYLYRLLGSVQRAEEVCQDVFLKAYRALDRLPEDANHRAWLYRIATNAAYDQLRRRKLIKWLPLLENDRSESESPGPELSVGTRQVVQQALAKLPAKYRAPLILYSVQGYSTREIGQMLSLSDGAVKTRLYRAREMFRKVMGNDDR